MGGLSARMETGDNKHIAVFLEDEKQGVGKAPHKGAAHSFEDGWKLLGILAHPFDHCVDRLAEASAQASYFASYQSCASISSERAVWVKITVYTTDNAVRVQF